MKRRSNDRAAVARSGEIDRLWGGKIDNTTGRAADVIYQRRSWFGASGVLNVRLLPSPFHHSLLPASPHYLGIAGGCLRGSIGAETNGECHVSLSDIEALCGLFSTGDRWCRLCVCARGCVETSGGHGHTTPETVVLGMSGWRTGSVFSRDRCDREE